MHIPRGVYQEVPLSYPGIPKGVSLSYPGIPKGVYLSYRFLLSYPGYSPCLLEVILRCDIKKGGGRGTTLRNST